MTKTSKSGANFIDRTSLRYGRWTVLHRDGLDRKVRWMCQCECGVVRSVAGDDLQSGRTNSCGCAAKIRAAANPRRVNRGAFVSWIGMKQRVSYSGHIEFHRYGGRGISIDPEWAASFDAFLRDMGPRPAGTSIERRDINGHYCKDNCYWASRAEQAANTSANVRVTHCGESMTLRQLADRLGLSYFSLHGHYRRRGHPLEEAIARSSPADKPRRKWRVHQPGQT